MLSLDLMKRNLIPTELNALELHPHNTEASTAQQIA